MERELLICRENTVAVLTGDGSSRSAPLERAGAVCACGAHVFCAAGEAIWRLDRRTLTPQALFAGGPGVCSLLPSGDGSRLYALSSDADSVLMISSATGQPMLLNRAGVHPRGMTLSGDVLAVAGGESGSVLLYDAGTMDVIGDLPMPGPVYSAALRGESVYALCLTPELDSLLVEYGKGSRVLPGLPGRLLACRDALYAQTNGWLYALGYGGSVTRRRAPGRAGFLARAGRCMLMLDVHSDRLFVLDAGRWRAVAQNVQAAALC